MGFSKVATSRLLAPGRIVGSIDGQPWLVLSSIKTKDGLSFKLADLMGSPVSIPPHFDPVPIRFSRFAAMLHLAFNKDIDAMMKALIRDAQLPVDQSMNWAKFLYSTLAKQLPTTDEDKIDEVLHFIIFKDWDATFRRSSFPALCRISPTRILSFLSCPWTSKSRGFSGITSWEARQAGPGESKKQTGTSSASLRGRISPPMMLSRESGKTTSYQWNP